MKKRIFSLAMVSLLILTVLGVFPAFADGITKTVSPEEQTVFVASTECSDVNAKQTYGDGTIVMSLKEQYATYSVDVEKAGKYEISVFFSYIMHTSYKLDIYVDDVLAHSGIQLGTTEAGTYAIGAVNLTPDTKTIKIQQSSDYAAQLKYVYIDLANQIEEKADLGVRHSTSYVASNAYLTSNSVSGDYISTEGGVDLGPNRSVIYDIYVKEEGNYAISMYAGEHDADIRWSVDVDEVNKLTQGWKLKDTTNGASHAVKQYLQVMDLTTGMHRIKLTVNAGTLRFFGLCIDKPEGHSVAYTEKTRLSAKDDAAYTSASEVTTDNATSGITNTDGRLRLNYGKKAFYIIDVEKAGEYNIGVIAGAEGNKSINLITEGGTVTKTFKPTEASVTYGTEFKIATVELNAGVQVIGIETNADSFYLYGITFVNSANMLSITNKVTVSSCDFTSKETGDVDEVYPNDTSSNGIIATGLVVVRDGYSYTYSLNVPESGNYMLSTVSAGNSISGRITDKDGNVLFDGKIANGGQGETAEDRLKYASETEVGALTLPKGINTITITARGASTYLYSLCFEYVAPKVAVYEGELAEEEDAYEVINGTMSFKAELNGYLAGKNALVVFAIYEKDEEGVKKLYKVYAEIVAGGNATVSGTVNDIVLDDEKTYTGDVFILDSETLVGKYFEYLQ